MAEKKAKEEKTEKVEKKFNGARMARQAEKSLKAVFPKDKFIASDFTTHVEVLYFESTTCTPAELNMFAVIFCTLGNFKREQLVFTKVKREAAAAPVTK